MADAEMMEVRSAVWLGFMTKQLDGNLVCIRSLGREAVAPFVKSNCGTDQIHLCLMDTENQRPRY